MGRTVYKYVGRDGSLRRAVAPGHYVCDFCLASDPAWAFPCGPMEIVGNVLMDASDDQWLTCDRCHDFIEEGDIEGLAQYAVKAQSGKKVDFGWVPPPESVALDIMRANGQAFMDARKGPAVRVDPATGKILDEADE